MMAGVKISNLPSVTTPLSGTESIAVVQNGITVKATATDLNSAVTYTASATGAINRSVPNKLNDSLSVKDFGAVGDNNTLNDSAFTATEAATDASFYLPDGIYKLGTINVLNKRYWGPGKIKFADEYIQAGVSFSDELPRNYVGNRVITSPTDIVMSPNGNVQFAGKRILNVADPVANKDAVNLQYLNTAVSDAIAGIYSKGTFTPTIIGETSAGTATYSLQYGRWTKIGDIVIVRIRVIWSSHTGTGVMYIPWTLFPLNSPFISPPGTVTITGDWTAAGTGYLYSYIYPNKIYIAKEYQDGTTNSVLTVQTSGTVDLQVIYEV